MAKVKRYYADDTTNPIIIKAILERLRLYIYAILYPNEVISDIGDDTDLFLPADVVSGDQEINRQAVSSFQNSNVQKVFTAYNVDDASREINTEVKNISMLNGSFYDPNTGAYLTSVPFTNVILMYSFFYNRYDYERAMSLLKRQSAMRRRLLVPIVINNVTTNIPLDIKMNAAKGTYALEFAQFLTKNRIFDISHPIDIWYYDVYADTNISPVDDMQAYLGEIKADDSEVRKVSITSMPIPVISNANPVSGSTGVAVDASIVFTFNVPMNESNVHSNITIEEFDDLRFTWDVDSLLLTINPFSTWQSSTTYTITIPSGVLSIYNGFLEEDYTYTFTTV